MSARIQELSDGKMRMIHFDEKTDLDEILREASNIKKWAPIDFGKYEGLSIPELMFSDPWYFYWALTMNKFNGWTRIHANVVEGRLRHIKPPKSYSEPVVFVNKLKHGLFCDFSIRKRTSSLPKTTDDVKITSHLDFSLVSRPNWATERARGKMLEGVKYHFFDKDTDKLRAKDFEGFLGDPDNFASGCRKKHIPDVPRWDDPEILAETKSQKAEQHELPPHVVKRIEEARYRKLLQKLNMYEGEDLE